MATKKKYRPKTPVQKFRDSVRRFPKRPVILAEGDSWFAFPTRKNIIRYVEKMGRFSLLSLASNGDEAVEMLGIKQKRRLRYYLSTYNVQALLFSAGGNDIVGEDMRSILQPVTDSKDWQGCLRDEAFARKLVTVRAAYDDLVDLRDECRPGCTIITHGYDYPYPSDVGAKLLGARIAGPWIKPYLVANGLTNAAAQHALAKHLIVEFNKVLTDLAKNASRFRYLKTPGTLKKNEWGDEIHPTTSGFGKIAAYLRTALQETFPDYSIS